MKGLNSSAEISSIHTVL